MTDPGVVYLGPDSTTPAPERGTAPVLAAVDAALDAVSGFSVNSGTRQAVEALADAVAQLVQQ